MSRFLDVVLEVVLFCLWLGGFMAGLFGSDTGDRVVGMLLWIGLGVGYRLKKIGEHTAATREALTSK